ncbi:transposase [uncultured Anaerococcus sp.]|uniref:transposase n=1 Tax=uncultured Anaerococcus sp. TaxID=293428 RepID=UPI00263839D3|nr:transposase [uncultured Anaerococcus sp.]
MAKYSTEFKIKVVKEYLETNISYKYLSEKYKLSHQEIVKRWDRLVKKQIYPNLNR